VRRGKDAMQDEIIQRMGEPEPYRSLRLQKERIEAEKEAAALHAIYDIRAAALRREIEALGEKPCA
jgi:hypothetical protein